MKIFIKDLQASKYCNLISILIGGLPGLSTLGIKLAGDILLPDTDAYTIILVGGLISFILFLMIPKVHNYIKNRKKYKIGFSILLFIYWIFTGGLLTLGGFAFINNRTDGDVETIMCPILYAHESTGKNAEYSAEIKLKGETTWVYFSHAERNRIILHARYIKISIGHGKLGYDYFVDKDIIE